MDPSEIIIRDPAGNPGPTEKPSLMSNSSAEVRVSRGSSSDAESIAPDMSDGSRGKNDMEKSQRKRQHSSSTKDRREQRDPHNLKAVRRDALDSWIAPEIAHKPRDKRIKVSDITEWDTWIAPDLREQEERLERRAAARVREKQREKERKKRNKRNRREVPTIDSWVADSHDDRGRRARGRSDPASPRGRVQDDSPKRSSRERQPPEPQAGRSNAHSRERTGPSGYIASISRSRESNHKEK